MPSKMKRLLLVMAVGILPIYSLVNWKLVFQPFIPPSHSLYGWGILFPSLGITVTWLLIACAKASRRVSMTIGIALSLFYLIAGYLSLGHAIDSWGAI